MTLITADPYISKKSTILAVVYIAICSSLPMHSLCPIFIA